MRYNRKIVEVCHEGATEAELKQYRNTLLQRRWYYKKWVQDRDSGVQFKDTRKVLTRETILAKLAEVNAEIEVVNNLIGECRKQPKVLIDRAT